MQMTLQPRTCSKLAEASGGRLHRLGTHTFTRGTHDHGQAKPHLAGPIFVTLQVVSCTWADLCCPLMGLARMADSLLSDYNDHVTRLECRPTQLVLPGPRRTSCTKSAFVIVPDACQTSVSGQQQIHGASCCASAARPSCDGCPRGALATVCCAADAILQVTPSPVPPPPPLAAPQTLCAAAFAEIGHRCSDHSVICRPAPAAALGSPTPEVVPAGTATVRAAERRAPCPSASPNERDHNTS